MIQFWAMVMIPVMMTVMMMMVTQCSGHVWVTPSVLVVHWHSQWPVRPVRLATLGLTVHMYTLYNISHRTVLLASNFKRLNTFMRRQTRIRNEGIPKINSSV